MDRQEIAEIVYMKRKQSLKSVIDLKKIKQRKSDGRFYIHVGEELAKTLGKELFTAKTEKELIDQLYNLFFGIKTVTLREAYSIWQEHRINIGTSPKTIQENETDWKKFYDGSKIADMKMQDIKVVDIKDFFYKITADHAISKQRFINAKTILNGVFLRCVELEIVPHNLVPDVDCRDLAKRFKVTPPKKQDYSVEEKKAIVEYLRDKSGPYDYAIRLSFHLFLRIGELIPLKYEDMVDGNLYIQRSVRRIRNAQMDEHGNISFDKTTYETSESMKGNTSKGFRMIPLDDEAVSIIEEVHKKWPDNEYLFMSDGRQLIGDRFNKKLAKICKELGIEYCSSHQIRFTNAKALYKADVPLSELSRMMGHTNTATTLHYIRQDEVSDDTKKKVKRALAVR